MKTILTTTLVAAATTAAIAQTWTLDPAHTRVSFKTKYLVISDVEGQFKKFEGKITSATNDWSDIKADITVDVASLSTDNEMRDNHLRSDDFFNAEKYPSISFKSKGIKTLGNNKFLLSGDLTIRDVTRQVELPLVYGGTVTDPWGNIKAGFKATGTLNRKDFNLKYSNAAATGEAVVSDNVEFTIDAILVKS
ncbi:MAG: YceI family protein [Bacteroidia bacterium]|nr:YceI family protein [Bacteroidia bacterium]